MNIFIFEDVSKLTGNYHSEGGAVVIAKSRERAVAWNLKFPKKQKSRSLSFRMRDVANFAKPD